jgi:hypothetical protein
MPQVAMRNASQIWQIFFPSQTLQVFCFSFAKPSDFLFGPSQKGTICSSVLGSIFSVWLAHSPPTPRDAGRHGSDLNMGECPKKTDLNNIGS